MLSEILLYSIKSAFVLALLYVPYTLALRKESFFRFNRVLLLSILLLSLLLPLCNFSVLSLDNQPVVHAAQNQMIEVGIPIAQSTQYVYYIEDEPRISWFDVVSIVYVIGMFIVLIFRLVQFVRMGMLIHKDSLWTEEHDGITVHCHSGYVAPCSWMKNIIIGQDDYEENGSEIILHEKGHIINRHSYDIILLTIVQMIQWWNPLSYMLGLSLRDIHEYEADDNVLTQGVSAQAYQMLLIKKAVGSSSYAFANNFNHSLTKKRIAMMINRKSNPWMRGKALYAIPMALVALSAFATPEFVAPIEDAVFNLENQEAKVVNQIVTPVKEAVSAPEERPLKISAENITSLVQIKEIQGGDSKSDPVIMVDNKIVANMDAVDKSEVDHINVIKSADAIREIYGDDAKYMNGVVEIYTKKYMAEKNSVKAGEEVAKNNIAKTDNNVYADPEVAPQFPGGNDALFSWISENLRYPESCVKARIQGRTIVTFLVEKDGSITDVRILKSVSAKAKELDAEALRVVSAMPKWIPGTIGGKPSRVRYTLPIVFRLPDASSEKK